jgi:ATP-dependent RNA helicase RhlE
MGYESMTPIQAQAIPVVLTGQGRDGRRPDRHRQDGRVLAAAAAAPAQARKRLHLAGPPPGARLVLLPTRELADQVAQQVKLYAKYTQLRSAVVFGGMDMKPQTLELKKGVEVLVATPGRLLDHIEAKNAVLNQVEYVVLDEADRMLDIGFLPDLQRILSYLPKERTTLLFSATFSPEIKRLANSYLQGPGHHRGGAAQRDGVHGGAAFLQRDRRRQAPRAAPDAAPARHQAGLCVRQQQARLCRLARSLEREGLKTTALHGDKSQDERLKALDAFKKGEVDLLVCHRRGGPRPGHQGRAGGVQLRRAVQRRRLRAPHRPHRPCGRLGPGGHLCVAAAMAAWWPTWKSCSRPRSSSKRWSSTKTARHPQAGPHQRRPPHVLA